MTCVNTAIDGKLLALLFVLPMLQSKEIQVRIQKMRAAPKEILTEYGSCHQQERSTTVGTADFNNNFTAMLRHLSHRQRFRWVVGELTSY